MPYTINGIGTWYYGSKNLESRFDQCEHCGAQAEIKSYDTNKFFVVVFVPVLPLGRYRIIDECGSCQRHYPIPFKQWQRAHEDALREATRDFEEGGRSPEKAVGLLQSCAAYRDKRAFLRAADDVERVLAADPDGLELLGSGYELFSEPARAERTYRKALGIRQDPRVRRSLGLLLIKQGRPAEAKEFFAHLFSPIYANQLGTLYWLVEGYQAQGKHAEARQVLEEMRSTFPLLEGDDQFKRYQKRVAKRLGSTRPLASDLLKKGVPASGGFELTGSLASAVAITASIALVIWGAYALFQGTQRQKLYLLNGLDHPYSVIVEGDSYLLPPDAPLEVWVPRRERLVIQASADLGWPESVEMSFATGFWASLNDRSQYVVNPDRLAILLWEQTEYAVNPVEKEMPHRIHLGRGFYAFDDVDYVFKEFPKTIDLHSSSAVAKRERISELAGIPPLEAYTAALEFTGPEDALSFLIRALKANPDDTMVLQAVATLAPSDTFAEVARPELEKRPVRVEWHRAYQSAMEVAGKGEEVVAYYRSLYASEPGNADLGYLLGRILQDPDEAASVLQGAAFGPDPSAYAIHAMAYQHLVEGRFEEALQLSLRALELAPDIELFHYAEEQSLLALRRFRPLIERYQAAPDAALAGESAERLVRIHVAAGSKADARAVIERYVGQLEGGGDPESAQSWRDYLESAYHIGSGDWPAFRESVKKLEAPRYRYQHELALGNYTSAMKTLTEAGEEIAVDHLLVSLAAARARDRETADREIEAAAAALAKRTSGERMLARCLRGEASPSAVMRLDVEPGEKAAALAVLAERTGDERFRRLARVLNFDLTFERYYLERMGF